MASRLAIGVVVVALGGLGSVALARDSQRNVADRAAEMIRKQIEDARPALAAHLSALYRLDCSHRPTVLGSASKSFAAAASNLRWMIRSELTVFDALSVELVNVENEAAEIPSWDRGERSNGAALLKPVAGKPIRGIGQQRRGKLSLASRGVTWSTKPGATVVAPRGGVVVFAGPLASGNAMVIESDRVWIVLRAIEPSVATGTEVTRGQPVAKAARSELTLEMRVVNDRGGRPVDPGSFAEQ